MLGPTGLLIPQVKQVGLFSCEFLLVHRLLMKQLNFVIVQLAPITVVGSQLGLPMVLWAMGHSIILRVLRGFTLMFQGSRYKKVYYEL
jgi:hypothetical protein